ncbi:hypothetical protein AR457_28195 [Streptomyces agglomeratus]|uniref:Uncharacterized protein n=1 Tax=Streptomyces agglomeratus TaxID=285458 RepID=A0A1E5PE14_9ACTN|nr:hypothetical protein [Streptomyces agglomeratus]OEJ27770.1 hypothetical protein AS594_28075 [Streptomyces agglomeratus]OEJ38170.1 hypothetical protein BGK70_08460 [Streptomyces agglomeratus]OEJ47446.1 hypothetical protein AR457_28195 [Streptomyces agglomeratus]OEJ50697.1 hypothetical protein BGK72_07935 [Streptomyces agglomeratus]OEJ58059.1 hypothetical protein BGM19_08805 [Streptomyces agglomeratus]
MNTHAPDRNGRRPARRAHPRPVRDHRTAEQVMKAILVVAAVLAAIVVPYLAFVIGVHALAG